MTPLEALLLTYAEEAAKAAGRIEIPKLIANLQATLGKISIVAHPVEYFTIKETIALFTAVLNAIS